MRSSVDLIAGGSATAYDYANADPINEFDLDGRCVGNLHTTLGHETFYFCKKQTRKFHRALKRHGGDAAAIGGMVCGALGAIGGPVGVIAVTACQGVFWLALRSVKKNLKTAVKRRACFTFTFPHPPPLGDTLPHFGNSKRKEWCK